MNDQENGSQYEIGCQLGGGAMTTVYRARDIVLDRLVALKVLSQGADETTRERFRQEARTAAMLEHPNIVRTYQVGQMPDSGLSFIAMELVNGPSLAQFLEKHPILSARDTVALLEPIACALAYAHGRGVIHRDVKPSNILLNPVSKEHPLKIVVSDAEGAMAPLLSDFGIAQALDAPELTAQGRTIGTPAYMSPEQCAGSSELDGRADIYALGAVLYRCLVGHPPFRGSTTQILHAHVYDSLLIPKEATKIIPVSIIGIVQKSMAKEPSERYQTALEMAEELAAAARMLADAPNSAGNPSVLPTSQYPSSREASTPSYILIPARTTTQNTTTYAPTNAVIPPEIPVIRTDTHEAAISGRSKRSRLAILLGIAFLVVSVLVIVAVVSVILPSLDFPGQSNDIDPTELAAVTTEESVSSIGTVVPGDSGSESDNGTAQVVAMTTDASVESSLAETETPDGPSATASAKVTLTPEPGILELDGTDEPRPRPTLTVTRALNVSPKFAWAQAQTMFEEQDWVEARTWLIALHRLLLDVNNPEIVDIDSDTVDRMLIESTVWLAAQAFVEGDYKAAAVLSARVSQLADGIAPYDSLADKTSVLAEADNSELDSAIADVQAAFFALGPYLEAQDRVCSVSKLLSVVADVANSKVFETDLDRLQSACDELETETGLSSLSGRILYSANDGEVYNIYQARIGDEFPSRILFEDGSQPSMSPDYETIAFYSWRSDTQGLVAAPMTLRARQDDDRLLLTNFVEDSRDSPPSWNPQSDRVVFGSTNFGDGRSRIYLTWADGNRVTDELGLGKNPAWHPYEDVVVYNGTDETGNNPGLWMMRTDGTERRQLTDNGNDQRPVWLPDGSAILFMSNGRDANWDLYRYNFADYSVTRLTDNIAQDGLPAVSLDGKMVAFMSDRAGYWVVWVVAVDGGEAQPLMDISGELPRWLEHSIQWVN